MKIDKVKDTYSEYKLTMSFGQLKAMHKALEADHVGPVADEMFKALDYYLAKLPLPGEDKDPKKEKEAEKEAEPKTGEPLAPVSLKDVEDFDLDAAAPNPPEE